MKYAFILPLLCLAVFFLPATPRAENPAPLRYEDFIQWRQDKDVVILNAWQLEPLLWVAPSDIAKTTKTGLTQEDFDNVVASLIPARDTRVVLYCYENFAPIRRIPARQAVAAALRAAGYTNVHELESLINRAGQNDPALPPLTPEFIAQEIESYRTPLSPAARKWLDKLRP